MKLSIPWRRAGALGGCAALLAAGALTATPGPAAPAHAAEQTATANQTQADRVTITPNPWYAGDPFEGWGTSLVWMANATGGYPDELREQLYQMVFGEEGLDLNIARYNIGGQNASDVQDYLRPGGAVDGYWAEDTTDELYGVPTTHQNREEILQAWDPDNPAHYDFTADQTQRWWVEQLVEDEQITHWEVFANSAPYFMTDNGYVSGGFDGADEQLRTDAMAKFAGYLTEVTDFLEREYGMEVDTIDPFNEPNTDYWSTQLENGEPVGGRQEGMHVGPDRQVQMLAAMEERLAMDSTATDAVISAMDETNPGTFARNWRAYTDKARSAVEQMNVHTYGTGNRQVVRDLSKANDLPLWMSEVGGNWHSGFTPVSIDNGLGIASRIQADLRELEPTAWVLWQPIEDLYNMQPQGENSNWGAIYVDFDCVEVSPGVWKSQRRIADADGDPTGVPECGIRVNSKFATLQNFTHFIRPGDSIIPTDSELATAAVNADGEGLSLVYRNEADTPQRITVDLSLFGSVSEDATVQPFVTTEGTEQDPAANAVVPGKTMQVTGQAATVTVPARSVTTIEISGVAGVAEEAAPVTDEGAYQMMGVGSDKALSVTEQGETVIQPAATTAEQAERQMWTVHALQNPDRGDVRPYVITSAAGRVLTANDQGTALRDIPLQEAAEDEHARWMLTTENGQTWSWVNEALAEALDVTGQATEAGASVGTWQSTGGQNQAWQLRSLEATGAQEVHVSTLAGTAPTMPDAVVPTYAWGTGAPVPVQWDLPDDQAWQQTGEVIVHGTAIDVYGNEIQSRAVVVVGGFTVTDPVSVTVAQGAAVHVVREQAPTTVPARVGASEITFPAPVEWDFSELSAEELGRTGVVTVSGTASSNDDEKLPATLSVIVTEPVAVNAAALESTEASATFTEPGYSVDDTRNGDVRDKAWSNWKSGQKNDSDTLTYTLGEARTPESATVYFYRDGSWTSWADSIAFEYRTSSGDWVPVPGYGKPQPVDVPEDGTAPVVTVDLGEVSELTGLRVVMDAIEDTHMIVAEVEIMVLSPGEGTVADLAALRVDGISVPEFAPDRTEYTVAAEGDRMPRISAFPVDAQARAEVVQPTQGEPRAVVTVTSGDGTRERTYIVMVVDEEDVPVQGSVVPRCVAGEVFLVATAQNNADVPAEVTISTEYGSASIGEVAPGKARSQAFATRDTEIPGGTVEVSAVLDGGASSSGIGYEAFSCQ